MSPATSRRSRHWSRNVLVVVVMLLSVVSALGFAGAASSSTPTSAPHALVQPLGPAGPPTPSTAPPLVPRPTAGLSALFLHPNSHVADQPVSQRFCTATPNTGTVSQSCFPQAQNPSLLRLANGKVAVAYSLYTQHTNSSCPAAATTTNSRLGFAVSADGGQTFGAVTNLGNTSCPYVNAIEPSFTVSSAGAVYGAFVEENFSNNSNPLQPGLAPNYGNRSTDALGFVRSVDNGTTFGSVRSIAVHNVARPIVASFGLTVYVVYENVSNGTSLLPLAYSSTRVAPNPISLQLIYSTNGGSSWTGPYTIPGQNPAENFTAFGASVAVNSTGTVAVAYATNRGCVPLTTSTCTTFNTGYGEDIVVATTRTNGSSWNGPYTVSRGYGEAGCYNYDNGTAATYFYTDPCLVYLFQLLPQTTITYGANGQTLYVAWSGEHMPYYYFVENSNLYSAASTNGGVNWNSTIVIDARINSTFTYDEYSTPTIGFSGGKVFLAYLEKNGTSCFISSYCSRFLESYSQWLTTSVDGLSWSPSTFLSYELGNPYTPHSVYSWGGFSGSMLFVGPGQPVVAYALNHAPVSSAAKIGGTVYHRFVYQTDLVVATSAGGPTVNLTFQVNGNPATNAWPFTVDGNTFSPSGGTTSVTVSGVPANTAVMIEPPSPTVFGYAHERVFVPSVTEFSSFSSNATVYFNASVDYGISFSYQPPNFPNYCLCLNLQGAYYIYIPNYNIQQPAFPWFFPAGSLLTVQPQINQGQLPTLYWTGTGNGSYNGPGVWANITMNAPINETVWNGLIGTSSVEVSTRYLPVGNAFSYSMDGTVHAGVAGTPSYVTNLTVGPHTLSGAVAPVSASLAYFGYPDLGSPILVPFEPAVNLTFAKVNLTSSVGPVSLHAVGILSGAQWAVEFNGTRYASSTPWINLTTRSGEFPFHAFPASTPTASAGFVPTTPAALLNVTSGGTTVVNYTAAYEVRIAAGYGGTASGPVSTWVGAGGQLALSALPSPGFVFLGWFGVGTGSYSGPLAATNITVGGPISESAMFLALPAARFNLTFVESGVPTGDWWTVQLNGAGYSSNGPTLTVPNVLSCAAGPAGVYAVTVPYAIDPNTPGVRYAPSSFNSTLCTTGISPPSPVTYGAQYLVSAVSGVGGTAVVTGSTGPATSTWVAAGASAVLSETPGPGYLFVAWVGTGTGSYSGSNLTPSVAPAGPISEVASFAPIPPAQRYSLTLTASPGLSPNTSWSVSVDGSSFASAGPTLVVPGILNGSHILVPAVATSPDRLTQYSPSNSPVHLTTTGNGTLTLDYSVSYWGAIIASSGGSVGPVSGWFVLNKQVQLSALPAAGELFAGWKSSDAVGYSGTNPNGSFVVTGPFTETASFAPQSPSSTVVPSSSSVWGSPLTWVLLAVVGLVIGLVVGMVLSRRGGGPATSTVTTTSTTTETSETYSGDTSAVDETAPPVEES